MSETEHIRDLCAEFLAGKWETFSKDIQVEALQVGFGNQTFRCTLNNAVPKDVIVKKFGSELTGSSSESVAKFQGVTGEMIVFHVLSTVGIAPTLLAAFDDGRIEQFIYGRNLSNDEYADDPSLFSTIAKILVKFHKQNMPVSKRNKFFEKFKSQFLEAKLEKSIEDFPESGRNQINQLFNFPAKSEFNWIEENVARVKSRIVFSHNDVHHGNIMKRDNFDSDDQRLILVDYEMASYNYRGYDLGYFLNNLCFHWSKKDSKMSIEFIFEIKEEIEALLIKEYLKELANYGDLDEELDTFDHLLMEKRFFTLLAQLAVICYSRKLLNTPTWSAQLHSFDFVDLYIDRYYKLKQKFLENYSHIFK